ncbi:MAG: DUF5655 domain-containing protein [Bacteroides sp.]|jgi:predicted transport protein|nr:DUF5655 domain-containing protein [Bacteroides sp.]
MMDQATQTMIENLRKNTGQTLEEWIALVGKENLEKHGQIIKFLKEIHGFTHGFANLVALKAKGSDAASAGSPDELLEQQYKGKEHFRPLYEKLMAEIKSWGHDIEVAPKKAYVSLRRRKQFALLQPVTKMRFEVGIILKGQEASGKLEAITGANAMCTHKISLEGLDELDGEVFDWLRKAYDRAG